MTKEAMEQIVKEWIPRLGLQAWDIKVEWDKPSVEGSDASTWRSNDYDRASLHFDAAWGGWTKLFAKRIVVHELLHLLTREVDRVVADLEGELHRDVYTQVDRRYDHEIEGLVDRLAYRLVDLAQ